MSSSLQHVLAEQFGVTTELHPQPLFVIAGSRLYRGWYEGAN